MWPEAKIKETLFYPEIVYPESDGEPMAETGFHVTLIAYFLAMLRAFYRGRKDVYVGADMLMYYREGDPRKSVAPDLFAAFGVPGHERRTWKVWAEGKGPDVVFEFTSRTTRDEDVGSKKGLYEWMGVREYFLFDPLGEYLSPQLQGYQLTGDGFHPMRSSAGGELVSEQLGVTLRVEENELRLFDRKTGERLLPPLELAEALDETEARLDEAEARLDEEIAARQAEAAARQSAEAEIVRLQAELERLRGRGR
jgi:Uma2 family endonuclease